MKFEVLKGCKRCQQFPKFSNYTYDYKASYAIVCCTTISGKDPMDVQNRWNIFNIQANDTYKYNPTTKKWEKIEVKNEP